MAASETIAAIATPPGIGGVGIVRVSGSLAPAVAGGMIGRVPEPRLATLARFRARDGETLDEGIALFFPAPHSFTGEDVLELQGHGGPVVLDLLLRRVLELGARPARPGEFSERAFLNGKLDLAQAEAVADLIESTTEVAARLAGRTLQGALSRRVEALREGMVRLRTFVEAAIDFPDEEIDFLSDSRVGTDLRDLIRDAKALTASARQGQLLREGLRLVIAGPPNAGKSSLLNALAGTDVAIVTEIPGTTRDLLHREIQIDGMPLHLMDTAGMRSARDPIEREGIRRAREQIEHADRILWVFDGQSEPEEGVAEGDTRRGPGTDRHFQRRQAVENERIGKSPCSDSPVAKPRDGLLRHPPEHAGLAPDALPERIPVTYVRNKIDLTGTPAGLTRMSWGPQVAISALTGAGMDALRAHLKGVCGFSGTTEGVFMARRRHLDALSRSLAALHSALAVLERTSAAELMAEELRQAQQALGEITGEFTPDDLLDRIFSGFCIGK